MDARIMPSADGASWDLVDLLGRSMGSIVETEARQFEIHPAGGALQTMAGMKFGPFPTLDHALAEIERHTRGTCRREPGRDRP